MPVRLGSDNDGCFARWGHKGAKYRYTCGNKSERELAEKKALEQGVAIGDFASMKISFDFDGTISKVSIQEKAIEYIKKGALVYIISARDNKEGMLDVARKVGISIDRVFATGSNEKKIDKIKELGIDRHYDNNEDVISKIGSIGEKV